MTIGSRLIATAIYATGTYDDFGELGTSLASTPANREQIGVQLMRPPSEYVHQTTLQLDLWGDTFASLERKAAESAAKGRNSIVPRLRKLRRKKRVLKRRLLEAAHGTSKLDWESVRDELEEALGDFRQLATDVYDDVKKA